MLKKMLDSLSESRGSGLKDEMKEYLEKEFKGMLDPHEKDANNFDMEIAIYWFANDYHGGQDSELYSVLSTSDFSPGPTHRSIKDEDSSTAEDMYDALKKKFKNR